MFIAFNEYRQQKQQAELAEQDRARAEQEHAAAADLRRKVDYLLQVVQCAADGDLTTSAPRPAAISSTACQ